MENGERPQENLPMLELDGDRLKFSFPEVWPGATLEVSFQRTLRIPDDDKVYPLPPGLGKFPVRHIDDFADNVPSDWLRHGGVMLPMYQAEAMWIFFSGEYLFDRGTKYPFAVKVSTGKLCAVSGKPWKSGLRVRPQGYVVVPTQPWLDGYCIEKGVIRQFVAMPLGAGYTAEEQLTGSAEVGGLQLQVYPMRAEVFEKKFPKLEGSDSLSDSFRYRTIRPTAQVSEMGLAPGGRMKQEIYKDAHGVDAWDLENSARCFVHITNSETWKALTGELSPAKPPTALEYTRFGLPWFDYYAEEPCIAGRKPLRGLKSVKQMGTAKGETPLPENDSCEPTLVKKLKKGNVVREGGW